MGLIELLDALPAADIVDEITKGIDHVPAIVSVVSALGILLLLPLYRSQRRDVLRLRGWMEREAEHPVRDLAASEAILDRTEAELERLGIGGLTEVHEPGTTQVPAATRVTSERPALTRITMERSALQPHPRWRRFVARATQPRVMLAVAVVALVVGAGGVFVSERLLSSDEPESPKAAKVDKASVNVAVLNGTSVNALGQKVGGAVQENGYELGTVTSTTPGFERTEVLYAKDQRRAARKVAKDLGVDADRVKPIDRESRERAPGADVVVIAGEDKAQP
jgi:hypothetical protein